ncbi:DGQHR domain-containing protein [Algoriphagus sp.]|uniref:DGQHR domain-containing protein n=1 Tax=Algoriphagus sp. TaxID=1872435 RepID=UPI002722B7AA|nr:DGQHR domain-containing protein [Algoriphagus sp.]MDO8968493.1 DGQHR domain-containing protein [Algoriphagus sp.]MDP3200730.1 DGQHR domain-containing protein [Algoriphagus sp.]
MLRDRTILAQKVTQNNQEFFIGIFSIRDLLKFTRYTKRLIVGYDDDNLPIYNNEIQRNVESSRVEKISDFLIYDPDAIFPTNLVISIPSPVISRIEEGSVFQIELLEEVFDEINVAGGHVHLTIIDGQHRLKGIERAFQRLNLEIQTLEKVVTRSSNQDLLNQLSSKRQLLDRLYNIELIVSFFIDPTLEFQAMIFSTINRTQKSVSQSLVYSLFGLSTSDSPQKTALEVVLSLNGYEKSPFFNRIKLYGGAYERNQVPPLTQAAMVKSIIDRISFSLREAENDRYRSRRDLIKGINSKLFFRKYYATNQDLFISDIMYAFFTAVRNTFVNNNGQSYWDLDSSGRPVNILQTTAGYSALLDLLEDILEKEPNDELRDKVEVYEKYLSLARGLNFGDIGRYAFTSISRTILYLDMSLAIWPGSSSDTRHEKLTGILSRGR